MGSSRTGTTLIRFLCESHSQIACSTDLDALSDLQHPGKLLARSLSALIPANHLLDNLPLITPNKHPLLTTKRDPVDVVASMSILPNNLSGTLLTTFVAPHVLRKMQTDSLFCAWMGREMEIVDRTWRQRDLRLAALGTLHYKWIERLMLRYEELGYPVHRVVYEELVTDPESVLRNLCTFMCVDFDPAMLSHHTQPHPPNRIQGAKMLTGNNDPFTPIHCTSIGRGYRVLSPEQIEVIQRVMSA